VKLLLAAVIVAVAILATARRRPRPPLPVDDVLDWDPYCISLYERTLAR